MTTTTGKIGFHFGSQSTATGYGDYIRELDAAGIPATVMSVAGEGFGDIVGVWNNGSTVPHVAVIRCLSHNDVPRYDLPIDDAVTDWLDRYVPTIGLDVQTYHDRVITKHGNELDRNKIEWLADFYIALHPRLLETMGWDHHQICIFNFAGGNPDPDQWELILPQLKIFADNPDKFVIGCHEYSFSDVDIWNKDAGGNLLIGRFQYLFDTCDNNNIKRPLYAIHEWGWRDVAIPFNKDWAMLDIDNCNILYCYYPEIIGAGIWTLQEWQGSGINLEVEKLIPHVKELTLSRRYEVGETVPPVTETLHEHLQRVAKEAQTVSYNRDAALQKAGNRDGFGITGSETRTQYGGIKYAVQPFGDLSNDAERYYYSVVGDWGNVKHGNLRGNDTPPIEPPPGQQIDVHDYFVPSGQHGIYLVMDTGNSTQPMQLEKRATDVILRKGDGNWIDGKKYQDSEQWRVKDGQVKKGIDTSDAGNGGRDAYNLHWAQWIPQIVTVGATYHSTPTVTRFNRTNCQVISESQANDYLYIKAVIPSWTSPANNNIVLSDVLVIEWRSGTSDLSHPPNETYYFAKNFGYVGWGNHFVSELPQGRAPLSGGLTSC